MWRMRSVDAAARRSSESDSFSWRSRPLLAHDRLGLQALLHDGEAQRDAPDGEHGEAGHEDDEGAREARALRRAAAASLRRARRVGPRAPGALRLVVARRGQPPRAPVPNAATAAS